MEKVVYLLGAGFSAPLGLPVMDNFLPISKDMYATNPDKYKQFQKIFSTIDRISVTKNYFEADLFNIEEILSILEMQGYLEGRNQTKAFCQYISDVITGNTPAHSTQYDRDGESLPSNYWDVAFNQDLLTQLTLYIFFASCLLNLRLTSKMVKTGNIIQNSSGNPSGETRRVVCYSKMTGSKTSYSVVTLNYDQVLENTAQFLVNRFGRDDSSPWTPGFKYENAKGESDACLAKLHGSVDSGIMVPPTWNKSGHNKLKVTWSLAHKLLEEANYIRILGYSLPASDAYVRYLLKSAVLKSRNLKRIDVLSLDPHGHVRRRYDEFVKFKFYRFNNADIRDYLVANFALHRKTFDRKNSGTIDFKLLEESHEEFMRKA